MNAFSDVTAKSEVKSELAESPTRGTCFNAFRIFERRFYFYSCVAQPFNKSLHLVKYSNRWHGRDRGDYTSSFPLVQRECSISSSSSSAATARVCGLTVPASVITAAITRPLQNDPHLSQHVLTQDRTLFNRTGWCHLSCESYFRQKQQGPRAAGFPVQISLHFTCWRSTIPLRKSLYRGTAAICAASPLCKAWSRSWSFANSLRRQWSGSMTMTPSMAISNRTTSLSKILIAGKPPLSSEMLGSRRVVGRATNGEERKGLPPRWG